MTSLNYQQLNALAELAAENVQLSLDKYIEETPALKGSFTKKSLGEHIGKEIASEALTPVSRPICALVANTVGAGAGAVAGGAIGTLFSPAGTLPGALLGSQGARITTEFVCNRSARGLGKYLWRQANETRGFGEIEQAKANLSSQYSQERRSVLVTLLSSQSAESQDYLRDQFNRNLTQQPFYTLLNEEHKNEIKQERADHKATLLQKNATYQVFINQNDAIDKVTLSYLDKVNTILVQSAPDTEVSRKAAAENDAFLKEWKAENTALDNQTQHKLNALLHEHKQYIKDLKEVLVYNDLLEDRYQEQLKREAAIAIYRGAETGFNFVAQLGLATNNRTVATIGSIGGSVTSIAFNAAMISGGIPGVSLSGWGLLGPYAAIGIAGLGIMTTLFGKKKKDDPQMKALLALSQQIEDFRQDVYRWIAQLGDIVVDAVNDIKNTMETNHAVIKAALSDGFNEYAVKLEDIQSDLNRLSTLSQRSLVANYLQKFSGTVSSIKQYISNTDDRAPEIEKNLVKLTTWLTDATYLCNTNGVWCLPDGLTADTLFSPTHLRDYDNLLCTDSCSKLGYFAKLASLIPGVTLDTVNIKELPNSTLFTQGVEAYAQGRLHLGTKAAKAMDPANNYLNKIKENVDNGLAFMNQLVIQESALLSAILDHYEQTYQQLKDTIVVAARERLETNTVPGFALSSRVLLNTGVDWPSEITSRKAGFNPLLFKPALLDAVKAKSIHIPIIIQSALDAHVGRITAYYTHSSTAAFAQAAGGNWNYCHWIQGRTVTFNQIEIGYELNGLFYCLYRTSSHLFDEGEIGKTATWKHKNPGEFDENNAITARMLNARDQNPILLTAWSSVGLTAIQDASNNDIPEKLKSALIEGIVSSCIVNHPSDSVQRHAIIDNILRHKESLNGLPQNLSSIKALLLQFASLTCTVIKEKINLLWSGADFIEQAANYQLLGQIIADLRGSIQRTNTQHRIHPIVQNLNYCRHLLDAINHHEAASFFMNSTGLGQSLQVGEELIFNPQLLECEMIPANKLGSGSFGEVYRAKDRQTANPLAVKVLYSGAKLLESARGELAVLSHLVQTDQSSCYLVRMLGVTQLCDREAIVMEFVSNGTLEDYLYKNTSGLSVAYRSRIAQGLIAGLSYLHKQDIIHGDLKDANVLLTDDYQPKIADYGLARIASDTQSRTSRSHSTKTLTGTLLYMAPELFDADSTGHPTKPSDVYALGVILWQILTLKKPFADLHPSFQAIAIYWVNVAVGRKVADHFKILPEPQEPEAAGLYRFFAPMIRECRAINPEDRPTAQALNIS